MTAHRAAQNAWEVVLRGLVAALDTWGVALPEPVQRHVRLARPLLGDQDDLFSAALDPSPPAEAPAPSVTGAVPQSRPTDRPTSRQAWLDNLPRARTQRRQIMEAVERSPHGLTAEEAAHATRQPLNSTSTRLSELERGAWVRSDEERFTSNGSPAAVYVLTTKGVEGLRAQRQNGR